MQKNNNNDNNMDKALEEHSEEIMLLADLRYKKINWINQGMTSCQILENLCNENYCDAHGDFKLFLDEINAIFRCIDTMSSSEGTWYENPKERIVAYTTMDSEGHLNQEGRSLQNYEPPFITLVFLDATELKDYFTWLNRNNQWEIDGEEYAVILMIPEQDEEFRLIIPKYSGNQVPNNAILVSVFRAPYEDKKMVIASLHCLYKVKDGELSSPLEYRKKRIEHIGVKFAERVLASLEERMFKKIDTPLTELELATCECARPELCFKERMRAYFRLFEEITNKFGVSKDRVSEFLTEQFESRFFELEKKEDWFTTTNMCRLISIAQEILNGSLIIPSDTATNA
ncbi:MAG: hypothetical protein JW891_11055 [Candidatus Lokiarchaeota archaeon]|nr:hypothetical protein [Candidatus Lokiarchaeota archaeon]